MTILVTPELNALFINYPYYNMFFLELLILTAFQTFEMTIVNDVEGIKEFKKDLTFGDKKYVGIFRDTKEIRIHTPVIGMESNTREKMRVFELIKLEPYGHR